MGFPVLVKAAAGGGGRGMKVARGPEDFELALRTARSEAKAAFGDDSVYLEKYLAKPRHIEFQVFGDRQGQRHPFGRARLLAATPPPKILEEAPSPALNAEQRQASATSSPRPCRTEVPRRRHGRVPVRGWRILLHRNEHAPAGRAPVTEMITGLDLVIEQIRIAPARRSRFAERVRPLRSRHRMPHQCGKSRHLHALARAPSPIGTRRVARRARRQRRYQGYRIPPYYDSLIGKLIVHGKNRNECLMRLKRCLSEFVIDGIETTIPLFTELVQNSDIANGLYDIHWLESFLQKP
jgi:acetyl-CoA carboxylase biotin carboxylase subunit